MTELENEIKEYIISEYPSWKVKTIFRIGIDDLISDEGYFSVDDKIVDYDMFYDIEIEKKLLFEILYNVGCMYDVKDIYPIKSFICEYISACIPSFARKWKQFKMDNMAPLYSPEIEWFNSN